MMTIHENRVSRLWVGRTDHGYLVRVEGRGTIKLSPLLQQFAVQSFEKDSEPSGNTVTVDLSACDYLDSTFLGCLLSLNRRYNHAADPRFMIAATPQKRRELLEPSNLNRVLAIRETCPESGRDLIELICPALLNTDLGRHVLECHRRLAEIEGPGRTAFRSIADRLESELEAALPGWM